jgi:hypothetical protein
MMEMGADELLDKIRKLHTQLLEHEELASGD